MLVNFINQPIVKQGIKNILSAPTLVFGCYELYDLFKKYQTGALASEEKDKNFGFAHFSLITTALMTPIGIKIPETLFCFLLNPDQRLRWFGPNTVFEHNPLHPRHLFSFFNLAIALPSTIKVCQYAVAKLRSKSLPKIETEEWMASWNVFTSRPVQHFVNAFLLKDLSRLYKH